MNTRYAFYRGEAKEMANYILKGHNLEQTATRFDTSKETVRRRLNLLSFRYKDLVEIREKRKAEKAKAD